MASRLSYREFKDEFLLAFAVASEADTSKRLNPLEVATLVTDSYQQSWISAATKELADLGYIAGQTFLDGSGSFTLSGSGLDRAERLAHEGGSDLYEMIGDTPPLALVDETDNVLTDDEGRHLVLDYNEPTGAVPARIVKLDPLAQAFKELDEHMADTIRDLKGSNSLSASDDPEVGQRLAEIEAGRVVLKAPQADANLFKRLVLPALTYLAKKVTDETVKVAIQKLIALITSFFGAAN